MDRGCVWVSFLRMKNDHNSSLMYLTNFIIKWIVYQTLGKESTQDFLEFVYTATFPHNNIRFSIVKSFEGIRNNLI